MSKFIHIGDAKIAVDDYAVTGTALLGTKGAGKTYAAKGIAEQLLDVEVPIIVFDPIGRWRFMKIAGDDHNRPRGYKLVVAGGDDPDLPLNPQNAAEIVRAAIRENIPLVLDLYDRKLSKADWRRIVQISCRTLMFENQGRRHIFLEEAAEFVPQKVMDGETYAEVEKIVRMGGNVSLGITLINQRAQEVNKAVLDLCENLVLMRQRGSNAIDQIERWTDKLSPDEAKAIAKSMPNMEAGECWVLTGSSDKAVHTKANPIRSFHPDRRKPELSAKAVAVRTSDTADFVTRLQEILPKIAEEKKANDPAELKKQIAELQRQIKTPSKTSPAPAAKADPAALTKARDQARAAAASVKQMKGILGELMKFIIKINADGFKSAEATQEIKTAIDAGMASALKQIEASAAKRNVLIERLQTEGQRLLERAQQLAQAETIEIEVTAARNEPFTVKPSFGRTSLHDVAMAKIAKHTPRPSSNGGSSISLPPGEHATLTACIQFPAGLRREQLTVLTQYKRSSRDAYIQRLREKGLVETPGDTVVATQAGIEALPDAEPLPTGPDLQEHWMRKLPSGEAKVLQVLIAAYPGTVDREALSESTGFARSSRDAYLQRMRAKQLITEPSRGEVRASEDLF